jgi:ABC-2 type transport system ATP-binding protein
VGLSGTGKKKAGKFSLGMKQRLSIAIALLHNPELLILDEPTNGLDPAGILEMRELLVKLNKESKITILISSHILSELEKIINYVGIINKGNILFQGSLEELHLKMNDSSCIVFDTNDKEKTLEIIQANNIEVKISDNQLTIPILDKKLIAELNAQLVRNNVEVYQISTVKNGLESIFMDLTKN